MIVVGVWANFNGKELKIELFMKYETENIILKHNYIRERDFESSWSSSDVGN